MNTTALLEPVPLLARPVRLQLKLKYRRSQAILTAVKQKAVSGGRSRDQEVSLVSPIGLTDLAPPSLLHHTVVDGTFKRVDYRAHRRSGVVIVKLSAVCCVCRFTCVAVFRAS